MAFGAPTTAVLDSWRNAAVSPAPTLMELPQAESHSSADRSRTGRGARSGCGGSAQRLLPIQDAALPSEVGLQVTATPDIVVASSTLKKRPWSPE
jgi:hypothetical protein